MEKQVDVVIIGAGSAGLSAASEVRKQTDNFVVINAGHYGTSCARVACMPTKALIEAANACHERRFLAELGVGGVEGLAIDRRKIFEHVRRMRDGFTNGMIKSTQKLGDRNIEGHARFIDANTIEVGDMVIKTGKAVIATGSRSIVPAAWDAFREHILITEEIFEVTDLPDTMAVIGLGAAGLEMAQALTRLGIRVTGIELGDMVGGLSDPEVNKKMLEALREEMDVQTGIRAELQAIDGGLEIDLNGTKLQVGKVLATMGRRPNVDKLGLENLGIEIDAKGRVPYDSETLQLADLPIFIAGDANSYKPLLHEAVDEGHIAGFNAAGDEVHCFKRRTPLAITFSSPDIVSVGKRYEQISDDDDCVIAGNDFTGQSRARMRMVNKGAMRMYARKSDGLLLGAEMAIPAGEHIGHLLAIAIQKEATVVDLMQLPFYHPVIEEGFQSILRELQQQLVHAKGSETELLLCRSHADEKLC